MGRPSAILTYHSLDDSGSVISVRPSLFRDQMAFLADSGIPVVPLNEALEVAGSIAITFDDGFRNLLDSAVPILERHKFPATIFLVGGYCGGRNNWPTQPAGSVPELPLVNWAEVAGLPGRISLGVHTMTHPHLAALAPEDCEREMLECRDRIEQHLSHRARWFAYPYGTSTPAVREIAARHFDLAVGTSLGLLPAHPEKMHLPRIDTYYLTGRFSLHDLFGAAGRAYIGFRHFLREVRRRIH
jgi:peptidoglycan/xylan/chitin deacetylase (PgdA/CDA1 family)